MQKEYALKRTRSDSAQSAVSAMVAAAQPILPVPKHVTITDDAILYWNAIICARSRDEWTDVDLIVGAQLAQCQADFNTESITLRDEGSVITNARGTDVMNPRHSVVEGLARREMALMRALRMGGKVVEDPRSKAGARKIEQESRKLREDLTKDDLLAL